MTESQDIEIDVVGTRDGDTMVTTITAPGFKLTAELDSSVPLAVHIAAQICDNARDLVGRGFLAIEEGEAARNA